MGVNPKVKAKFDRITEVLSSIDGVSTVSSDGMQAEFRISGHAPLSVVKVSFFGQNRFWTQNYDTVFLTQAENSLSACGELCFKAQKGFYSKNSLLWEHCAKLNSNELLSRLLKSHDLTRLRLLFEEKTVSISLSVLYGSVVRMLFPPAVHQVKPYAEDLVRSLQILQLIQAIIQ